MSTPSAAPDPEALKEKTKIIGSLAIGAHVSAVVCLGLRLGLYRALAHAGPLTSDALAQRTGLHERWVREWLYGQAAADIIEYRGEGRFELSAASAALLADEDALEFMGVLFDALPHRIGLVGRLEESFRTGLGLSWDDRGPAAAVSTHNALRNWHRTVLVPVALPALEGVVTKLEAGATVVDLGCGSGMALIELAKRFPRSRFHGYEISEQMLTLAEANRAEANLRNLAFHHVAREPLPADGSIDLALTFDCLHDMPHPEHAATAIRAALRADGTWFIADPIGEGSFEANLARKRYAALSYALSVLSCLPSALSERGGAGLGTLGLPEPTLRALVAAAGFRRFRPLDLPHRFNAYYEVRP